MALPKDERKRLLAKIHVAKKQLDLSDAAYEQMLWLTVGAGSCKELDALGLQAVLDAMKALGFRTRLSPNSRHKEQKTRVDKIRALWINLHKANQVQDGSEAALNAWIKGQTQVERVEWLNSRQLNRVIESLKKWLERADSSNDQANS